MGVALAAGRASAQAVEFIQLPSGFVPNALSADGTVVVGFNERPVIPYMWSEQTGLVRLLGPAGEQWAAKAWACSADGSTIVGTVSYEGHQRPFKWTAATGIVPFPSLGYGNGYDISDDGSVLVGDANVNSGASGCAWNDANGVWDLLPPEGVDRGIVSVISGDGRFAVGSGGVGENGAYVRWDLQSGTAEALSLPAVPGDRLIGFPEDCNTDGSIIVGLSINTSQGHERGAVMWTVNGLEIIGTGANTRATAVSGDGLVVGGWQDSTSWLQTPGIGRTAIGEFLSSHYSFTPPINLSRLRSISEDGRTIMGGYISVRGWIIRLPQSRPADFNRDRHVDFADLADYIDCFEGNHLLPVSSADLNRDGITDFFDLMQFMDDFES